MELLSLVSNTSVKTRINTQFYNKCFYSTQFRLVRISLQDLLKHHLFVS